MDFVIIPKFTGDRGYFVHIDLNNMGLTELPDLSKFNNIYVLSLDCSNNKLTSLPELPSTITHLSCYNNQLTSLPELPSSITNLNCYNNQLTSLPKLPPKLEQLYCHNNLLTSLPKYPSSCISINCSNNKLTSLPDFPPRPPAQFIRINCSNNKLTSLPIIPSYIHIISINNPISYLPEAEDGITLHFKPTITPIKEEEPMIKEEEPIPNKKNMRIINNFKHLYYSLKFKRHFYKLLNKIRERKTNKTNRIIIAILLIILVIVVIKIIIMMSRIMFGKHELSNNQLPYSRTDSYELIKDKQIKQICITPSQTEPIQYIF
jgi:hypothetical protein